MANIVDTPGDKIRAKYSQITKKAARKAAKRAGKKGSPVVSGGLPSLGKRK